MPSDVPLLALPFTRLVGHILQLFSDKVLWYPHSAQATLQLLALPHRPGPKLGWYSGVTRLDEAAICVPCPSQHMLGTLIRRARVLVVSPSLSASGSLSGSPSPSLSPSRSPSPSPSASTSASQSQSPSPSPSISPSMSGGQAPQFPPGCAVESRVECTQPPTKKYPLVMLLTTAVVRCEMCGTVWQGLAYFPVLYHVFRLHWLLVVMGCVCGPASSRGSGGPSFSQRSPGLPKTGLGRRTQGRLLVPRGGVSGGSTSLLG